MTMYPVLVGEASPKTEDEGKKHFHYHYAEDVPEFKKRGFLFSVISDPLNQHDDIRETLGDYAVSANDKKKLFSLKMAVRSSGLDGDFFIGILTNRTLYFAATDHYRGFVTRREELKRINGPDNDKMHFEGDVQFGEFQVLPGDRITVVSENVEESLSERILTDVLEEYTVQLAASELSKRSYDSDGIVNSQVINISSEFPAKKRLVNVRVLLFALVISVLLAAVAMMLSRRIEPGRHIVKEDPVRPADPDPKRPDIKVLKGNFPLEHKILWEKHFDGSVTSSPAEGEGMVLVASKDTYLYAYSKPEMELKWRTRMAYGIAARPLIDGDSVFLGTYKGYMYKLSLKDGAIIWKYRTGRRIITHAVSDRENIYFVSTDGYIYAVDKANAATKWKFPTKSVIWSAPLLAGDKVIAASLDRNVYAVSRDTGKQVWRMHVGSDIYSSPAEGAGMVFVGADDGFLYALSVANGNMLWKTACGKEISGLVTFDSGCVYFGCENGKVYCLDAKSGAIRWEYQTGDAVLSGAEIHEGILYIGSYDGNIYALNREDGGLIWKAPMTAPVYGKPLYAGGMVIAGDEKGALRCFQADLGKLKPVVLE